MVLTVALVESALQLVPPEIQAQPQIVRYAERRQKRPNEVLLDRAFHHAAMLKLAKRHGLSAQKMGRPDVVHNTLLQVLETPLNWEGQLRVIVHTQEDRIITINPNIRLPKNYVRFVGLVEQLFALKKVPTKGEPLMSVAKGSVRDVVRMTSPTEVIGFSRLGRPALLRSVADKASRERAPLALIGAFPRGHFTEETRNAARELYRVDKDSLDAWVVAGRFVYDFESAIGLAESRAQTARFQ